MTELNSDENRMKESDRMNILLFAVMSIFVAGVYMFAHYGLITPTEDSPMDIEGIATLTVCMMAISILRYTTQYVRTSEDVSDKTKDIIRYGCMALGIVFFLIMIETVVSNSDRSWQDILVTVGKGLAVGSVIACIIACFIYLYHRPKKEDDSK